MYKKKRNPSFYLAHGYKSEQKFWETMENKQVSFLKTCINGINALSGMFINNHPFLLVSF
jgi:hypothetical protein